MSNLNVGDYVRWVVDVDRVYSSDTKTLVGKVGMIVPADNHNVLEDCFDVEFSYDGKPYFVWNIPNIELVRVDAP